MKPTSRQDEKEKESELIQFLAKVPLFSVLSNKELKSLLKESREVSYSAGKVIMKKGDPSTVFHLILSGKVEIRTKSKTIASLGRGEFFGELGLIENEPRSADVVAIEQTRCFAVTSWVWMSHLIHNPNMTLELVRVLARRLRNTSNSLAE